MAHLGYFQNEHGTWCSRHRCEACGGEFTCTAQHEDITCNAPPGLLDELPDGCPAYDSARDVAKMIREGTASFVMVEKTPTEPS